MRVACMSDEPSGKAIARLAAGDQLAARYPCWSKHYPERTNATLAAL